MKKKTFRKLEFVLHILTGLLLLLKGLMEIRQQLYFPGIITSVFALAILSVILLWKLFKIKPKEARVACYFIESPALFLTAYMLYLEGKEFHPYIFFMAGLLYPALGIISSKRFKRLLKG